MTKTANKKGFTIVELVIVIAVIAILAAVLIPTFNSVIKKADESSAQQKARNALTVYASSIDSKFETGKTYTIAVKDGDEYYIYNRNTTTGKLEAASGNPTKTAPSGTKQTVSGEFANDMPSGVEVYVSTAS